MDNLVKVADGFHFLEGPRWHENKLWFSDMHGYKVHNPVSYTHLTLPTIE